MSVERLYIEESGRILATLIRLLGNIDLAEEVEARGDLRHYHLLPAARVDLLRRLGRRAEAADAYRCALALVGNDLERRFPAERLAEAGARVHASTAGAAGS